MKKMPRYCAGLLLLITGCAQQTFTVPKQTGSSSTKGNHHPSFLRFHKLGRRKLSMQPKFVAAQKMLFKTEITNIRKWLAVLYFRHLYSAGSAVCAHNNYMSCPSIWATLSLP